MLRKVFGSCVVFVPQNGRYVHINRFLCTRESLNPTVEQQNIQAFQTVAHKYNLSGEKLVSAIQVYNLAVYSGLTSNFADHHLLRAHQNQMYRVYQNNSYCGLGNSLEETQRILKFRYPELQTISEPSTEKVQALLELEKVFVSNGPNIQNFAYPNYGSQFVSQFKLRIDELVVQYEKQYGTEVALELKQHLEQILESYINGDGVYYGLLKSIIDRGLKRESLILLNESKQINEAKNQQDKDIEAITKGFTAEEIHYAKNVDSMDFKALLEENASADWARSKAQNSFNEQGQKYIYDTQTPEYHVLRYQIMAALFGFTFLYLLYRGDAKYKTILAVPALGYGFFLLAKQRSAQRNIPYVKTILLNQDNTLEVLIERNRVLSRIQSVSENNFKIHNSSRSFFEVPYGSANTEGYKCTINDQPAILPFNYIGNAKDFHRILQNTA